jgi:hypothetical protein
MLLLPSVILSGAVMWRECERRARIAGDYLANILEAMPSKRPRPYAYLITHSLGAFAALHAAQQLYANGRVPLGVSKVFGWYTFAGALPSSAFGATGIFNRAPYLVKGVDFYPDDRKPYTFHSAGDAVLLSLYALANPGVVAMGQAGDVSIGADGKPPSWNVDTTSTTGINHGSDQYFRAARCQICRTVFVDCDRSGCA